MHRPGRFESSDDSSINTAVAGDAKILADKRRVFREQIMIFEQLCGFRAPEPNS